MGFSIHAASAGEGPPSRSRSISGWRIPALICCFVVGVGGLAPEAEASNPTPEVTADEAQLHCEAAGYLEWGGLVSDIVDGVAAITHVACGHYVDGVLFAIGLVPLLPGGALVELKNVAVKVGGWAVDAAQWIGRKSVDAARWAGKKVGELASWAWDRLRGKRATSPDPSPTALPIVRMADLTRTEIIDGVRFTTNAATDIPVTVGWSPGYGSRKQPTAAIKRELEAGFPVHLNRQDYVRGHICAVSFGCPNIRKNYTMQLDVANRAQWNLVEAPVTKLRDDPRWSDLYVQASVTSDDIRSSVPVGYRFDIEFTDVTTGRRHSVTVEIPNSEAALNIKSPWLVVFPALGSGGSLSTASGEAGSESSSDTYSATLTPSPIGGGRWVANVASFRSWADAQVEQRAMAERYGRSFTVAEANNGWFSVNTGVFDSSEAAWDLCGEMARSANDCYPIWVTTS